MKKGLVVLSLALSTGSVYAMESSSENNVPHYLEQWQKIEGVKPGTIISSELVAIENDATQIVLTKDLNNAIAFVKALEIRKNQLNEGAKVKKFLDLKICYFNNFLNDLIKAKEVALLSEEKTAPAVANPFIKTTQEKLQEINAYILAEKAKIDAKEVEIQDRTRTMDNLTKDIDQQKKEQLDTIKAYEIKIEQIKQEQANAITAHENFIQHLLQQKEARRNSWNRLTAEKENISQALEKYIQKTQEISSEIERVSPSLYQLLVQEAALEENPSTSFVQGEEQKISEPFEELLSNKVGNTSVIKPARLHNPLTWVRIRNGITL